MFATNFDLCARKRPRVQQDVFFVLEVASSTSVYLDRVLS